MRTGFEGGQMPLYMRLGKLRGPNHKKSMPMGPFRTYTTPVNLRELERFDAGAEVTPELLKQAGVVRSLKHPIKILASGELTKKLTVHAHKFSAKAVEAIEGAGGTVVRLGGGDEQAAEAQSARRKTTKAAAAQAETEAPAPAPEEAEATATTEAGTADTEPEAEAAAEPAAEDAVEAEGEDTPEDEKA
jgi:ribosomal protein L15